ncbi:MAG: response regulator [Acidobacteriia bacterium]|nr:response regulator [Terriglobia bacterium]
MGSPLRIIFIGESGVDTILAELRRGQFEPVYEQVSQGPQLTELLSGNWDLAIAESVGGSGFGALQALSIIQESGVDLPLIAVTTKSRQEDVIAVLKSGAADHMTRRNLMRLNAAVERELRAVRLRRERNRLEEQFRQAQKMEAVGRLAGGVAHDFNNLLTVITGYSDLLLSRRDLLRESQCTALEEIRRSAERGGALTNQLLTFSRRQPLQTHAIHLNELVLQIQKLLRRLVGEDIEIVTLPAAGQDIVEADTGRLEQVVLNLVVNARDAMPDGGKLTIETATVHLSDDFSAKQLGVQPGAYVTLSILDTGIGMSQETQTHLFEPFFTTKGPGRGTGLGLATAYGIIRQSGGAIRISSEQGQGTTARIYLPLASRGKLEPRPEPARQQQIGGAETLLLVEDEARVRKLLLDILKTHGYNVLEATRGEEALRVCLSSEQEIKLAIVDVVMPEMSGPDLVRQLTRLKPDVRVLYISGYTDEALLHHGIQRSGAAFLEKPFLPEALLRRVREVLDSRSNSAPQN